MDCPISREEFHNEQQRLHQRVDEINASAIRTESVANSMKETVDKLYAIILGNGKPGVVTRVSNMFIHLKLQYALIFLGISGMAGVCFFVIRTYITK